MILASLLVKDEARSYIARSPEKFDIIQASLIDTFAATSAGAFVLTENSLYTLEGWKVFLDHLTDRGVLTMTHGKLKRVLDFNTLKITDAGQP